MAEHRPSPSLPDGEVPDVLDDATRRELLRTLARVGATAAPVSLILLDEAKAMATGSTSGFQG